MKNHSIFLILVFTLLLRLYHIAFPVIGWHSWRQADTAAIARNFSQDEQNILYPQIDWRGDTEGYVESEFQIYPFLVSLLYDVFGINEFFGRLLSVIFSVFTVFGIYLLVRKIINEHTALWSAFIYAVLPLNIFFGRAFMPESAMLMCSVYGIYFFVKYVDDDKLINYILSLLFIALAALLKLPELYLGLPLAYLCYKKFGNVFISQWRVWLFAFTVLLIVGAWYYHAHLLNLQTGLTFSIWNAGKDKWGMIDPLLTIKFYNDIFFKSIAERHLTYPAFIVFLWGLFIKRQYNLERVFDWWLLGMIIFIFLAPQAHLGQEYYQLPFNIPASVFIGKVFASYINVSDLTTSFRKSKFAVIFLGLCLISIFILSFLRMQNFMKSETMEATVFEMAIDVKECSGKEEKFITFSDNNPAILYIINRKGWVASSSELNDQFIKERETKGAAFIIGEKSVLKNNEERVNLEKIKAENIIIKDTPEYFIIKLN